MKTTYVVEWSSFTQGSTPMTKIHRLTQKEFEAADLQVESIGPRESCNCSLHEFPCPHDLQHALAEDAQHLDSAAMRIEVEKQMHVTFGAK